MGWNQLNKPYDFFSICYFLWILAFFLILSSKAIMIKKKLCQYWKQDVHFLHIVEFTQLYILIIVGDNYTEKFLSKNKLLLFEINTLRNQILQNIFLEMCHYVTVNSKIKSIIITENMRKLTFFCQTFFRNISLSSKKTAWKN